MMEHVPEFKRRCLICEKEYTINKPTPCPGPRSFGAPDETKQEEFAAKIRTLSIHPKGR